MKSDRVFSSIYELLMEIGIGDTYLAGSKVLSGARMRAMTELLDTLSGSYSDDSESRKLMIGNALFSIGNYETAAELYRSISEASPTNWESRFNLALCMGRMQKPKMALKAFDELSIVLPSFCEIYYQRAKLYDDVGESERALENYEATLDLDPGHVRAKFNMGLLLAKMERHGEAVEQFSQVLFLRPSLANAYLNRGVSREELGNYDLAIEDYTTALEIDYANENAIFNRARINYQQGRLAAAKSDYTEFLWLAPNDSEAYNNRGLVYDALGDEKSALRDYDKALEISPQFGDALNNKGAVLESTGDLKGALSLYLEAIESSPAYSTAYFNTAKIYLAQMELVLAEDYLKKAIGLNRDHLIEALEDEQLGWLMDVQGVKYRMDQR